MFTRATAKKRKTNNHTPVISHNPQYPQPTGNTPFPTKQTKTTPANHDQRSTSKIMRTVDAWMRNKDLSQALLRGAGMDDVAFSTMQNILTQCASLKALDLSLNALTMDSCSELCQLMTTSPKLTCVSLEGTALPLKAIGYLMTAIMERDSKSSSHKTNASNNTQQPSVTPFEVLDLQRTKGVMAALSGTSPSSNILKQYASSLGGGGGPRASLLWAVSNALWLFLKDTGHPHVAPVGDVSVPSWHLVESSTIKKMENALKKVLLADDDSTSLTADRAILFPDQVLNPDGGLDGSMAKSAIHSPTQSAASPLKQRTMNTTAGTNASTKRSPMQKTNNRTQMQKKTQQMGGDANATALALAMDHSKALANTNAPTTDAFEDLKAAFERPKHKAMTFNLKQVLTKNGSVLMSMLERLLETTSIAARDVESGQTLIEYACVTGNVQLAKLCYRRGANLEAWTVNGETPLNITVRQGKFELMEFLHTYGVRVNSADRKGRSALHMATANNNIDAICRLVEWGADCDLRDEKMRTPLHYAAIGGHSKVAMLLLELGADLNARDCQDFTPVAHAEANDHFQLMDRLVELGGEPLQRE